jgi:hypothetical protein
MSVIVVRMKCLWCFVGFYVLMYSCNGVRRHLNPTEVAMAVQMLLDGHWQREVARTAGVSKAWLHGCGDRTRRQDSLPDALVKVVRAVQPMLTTALYGY